MEFINATEVAKITSAARAKVAFARASVAEYCVKEDIMPSIVEEAEGGGNVTVVKIAPDSDTYEVKDWIIFILTKLGYNVRLGENNREFIIEW